MTGMRMSIEEMVAGRDGREAMTLADTLSLIEVLADSLDTMKEEMAVTHQVLDPTDLSNTLNPMAYAERLDDDGDGGEDPKPEKPKPKPKPKDEPAPDPDEPKPDMTPPDPEEQPEVPEEGLPGTGGDQRIIVGSADAGVSIQK